MAEGDDLLASERDQMRFGANAGNVAPGPGEYHAGKEWCQVNYNLSSIEGSFGKEERKLLEGAGSAPSPGPIYLPPAPKRSVGTVFGKASRFPSEIGSNGPGFPGRRLDKSRKPQSEEGSLTKAKRVFHNPRGADSPGPKYTVSSSLGSKPTATGGTLSRASRFPEPEDDEGASPGPIYLPPSNLGQSRGATFGRQERFHAKKSVGTEFMTGEPTGGTVNSKRRRAPAFTFGSRPRTWTQTPESDTPGPIYNARDNVLSRSSGSSPSYSFAAPDSPALHAAGGPAGPTTRGGRGGRGRKGRPTSSTSSGRGSPSPTRSRGDLSSDDLGRGRSVMRKTFAQVVMGQDSPGPAQYLIQSAPSPKAFSFGTALRTKGGAADKLAGSSADTPLTAASAPSKSIRGGTIPRAPRNVFKVHSEGPGPAYSNDKWTVKTPIRHGVATQTTNYMAKAEAQAEALREQKERDARAFRLDALDQEDRVGVERARDMISPKAFRDIVPVRKDKFMVHVWY